MYNTKQITNMKKFLAIVMSMLMVTSVSAGNVESTKDNNDGKKRIAVLRGSDNVIQKTIQLSEEYTKIEASRGVKVEIEERPGNEVIIWANDNVMEYVEVEVEEGELEVSIDDDINSLNNVRVIVSLPNNNNITKIEVSAAAKVQVKPEQNVKSLVLQASSAGEITFARANVESFSIDASSSGDVQGVIKADNGYVEATSAADITLTLLARSCSAKATSSGDIELEGEVRIFNAEASSAGKVDGEDLLTHDKADVRASSAGKVLVNADGEIAAKASSGGAIRFKGKGNVAPDVSSGGTIKHL